jgi:cell division protein FtsN
MAKDYKHRAYIKQSSNRSRKEPGSVGLFKSMLITAVLIAFAVFLVYLKSPGFNKQATIVVAEQAKPEHGATQEKNIKAKEDAKEKKPHAPHFDFYTILPKKELVVPDYEAKTRVREEQVGKHKKTNYILQAGSYTNMQDADELKAKLALMGIESKIQKAKVESTTWFRVKIGPYSQIGSVNEIMSRLKKNGMKPVITEVDG